VAGSTGERQQEDGIGIVLTTDKDEETLRKERLKEAAAKKQQNIMPLWHLRSTITDDLTALGIKENAQNAATQVAGPSNLDESLKGLGKVVARPSSSLSPPSTTDDITVEGADGDVKPGVTEGNEADCKACPVLPPHHSFPFVVDPLTPPLL
jgi:transcription initiation factor TFIIE subunit alpha